VVTSQCRKRWLFVSAFSAWFCRSLKLKWKYCQLLRSLTFNLPILGLQCREWMRRLMRRKCCKFSKCGYRMVDILIYVISSLAVFMVDYCYLKSCLGILLNRLSILMHQFQSFEHRFLVRSLPLQSVCMQTVLSYLLLSWYHLWFFLLLVCRSHQWSQQAGKIQVWWYDFALNVLW